MQSLIFKSLLSVGMMVLFASDCNPTPDPIAGQALFKRLAFTVDKVKYDFDFEAEPTPGTLAINNSAPTNLANAQQTASGATLVVDGKTYGIAYKNINDTVYLTLTLPEDVTTLPTTISFNTLSVSNDAKLVDEKGDEITTGKDLTISKGAFTAQITSEDGTTTALYNIQLKKAIPSKEAFFKRLAFTVDKVNYDFDFEAEPTPGTFAINNSTPTSLANALQAGSGYTLLVVDGKTYGFNYQESNNTVSMTLTLPEDVTTLPTTISFNTLSVSDNAKLVDEKGDEITTGKDLTITDGAFTAQITSEDGTTTTLYNIQLKEPLHTGSTLMSLRLTGTNIEEVIMFTATQTQAMISLPSTVPDQVTVSELMVSEGATVTVGGEMIQTDQEKEINFNGSPIIFTVTSQSGISTDYTIVFDLQNNLNSLVLEVAGEGVELQVSTNNTNEWIGEIGFDNALTETGSSTVLVTSLSLSDNNRARIIPTTGEPVEVMMGGSFSLDETSEEPNEYRATLEVYVEGNEDDKQAYTLRLQRNSIMMKSYSQEMLGTEVPTLGIALLDALKDPNNPTEVFDYPVLTISGLQKQATNYRLSIGDKIFDKEIKSTAGGEFILMKRDFMPETDILTKTVTADIKLLPAGAEGTEIETIGKYDKSKIRDWKDLQGMRMDLGASYTLENDIVLPTPGEEGLPQEGFEPIGTLIIHKDDAAEDQSTPFTGKLYGVDKGGLEPNKIMRLRIDRFSEDGVGLFAYVTGAEIRNLIIERPTVNGKGHAGALAGFAKGSTIEGVGVTGGGYVRATNYVGGLVGRNEGAITSCYATGDVEGTDHVGGLLGDNRATITSCYATGDVTGTGNNIGGLVGYNRGSTTFCYATGAVEGTDQVGGLAGYNSNRITFCYATGAVKGGNGGNLVGGLIGYNVHAIASCYYDKTTTGQPKGIGSGIEAGVTGLENTAAITQQSDLDKFDFVTVWDFKSGQWPKLKWETN